MGKALISERARRQEVELSLWRRHRRPDLKESNCGVGTNVRVFPADGADPVELASGRSIGVSSPFS